VFKLTQITKDYREAPALCSQVNLFGFVDDELFLTKTGDLGIVLSVAGVDYECLDSNTIENLTRRLTAAFRIFDEKCRVYQYLFKRNREGIPFKTYGKSVVDAAIQNRIAYLRGKADSLYSFEIYYVVLYEGFRFETSILESLAKLSSEPGAALTELRAILSTRKQLLLLDSELERARMELRSKARAFLLQVGDFVSSRIVSKDEAFRFLKQILNFSSLKIGNARLKHDTFLDYYLCESHLECHRGFLRVDDYYLKALTLKEPSAQSVPLIFRKLLEVEARSRICASFDSSTSVSSRAWGWLELLIFARSGSNKTPQRAAVSFTRAVVTSITPNNRSRAISAVLTSPKPAKTRWLMSQKKRKFAISVRRSRSSKSRGTTSDTIR